MTKHPKLIGAIFGFLIGLILILIFFGLFRLFSGYSGGELFIASLFIGAHIFLPLILIISTVVGIIIGAKNKINY